MPKNMPKNKPRRASAMPRRTVSAVSIAGVLALAVSACSASSTTSNAGASAGAAATSKITTAWPADVTTLDPANLSTNEDHELSRNLYQTLALPALVAGDAGQLNAQGEKVTPYLAQSIDVGTSSITYHLRTDVTFNGTSDKLTADDVKFSLDRIFATPGAGDLQSNGVQGPANIKVVDEHTVEVDFTSKDGTPMPVTPTLQAMFGQHFTGIVDKKLVMPHVTGADPTGAQWLRSNVAGSGPYVMAARSPGTSIVLKAATASWLPAPSYPEVDIQITSGSIASLLQSHAINFGEYGMTNQQVQSLAKAGLTVNWRDTGNFDMFAITAGPTGKVGPLGNPLVRQAIGYALPYDLVFKNIIFGRGSLDHSIVMPTAPEYTPAWKYTTDLAKAKQLLAQAGNPTINVPLQYLQGDVDQTNTAILIQGNLKQIGINATLTPQTQAGLFDVLNSRSSPATGAAIGPPGLELLNWSGFSDDPSVVIGYWATTGGINNYPLWASPDVDKIDKQFAKQNTSAARTAAYQKAQQIIAEAAPLLPIVSTATVTVVAQGIEGVSFSAGGSGRFWTMHPSGQASKIDALLFP